MKPAAYSFGLIGYPLGHSLSPRLHAAALRSVDLAGEYRLLPIPPNTEGGDAIRDLLEQLRSGELHGLNVTIPHKQSVLPWLDELTPVTRATGAANTLFHRNGRLTGDNTDAPAFLTTLHTLGLLNGVTGTENEPPLGLILGAGGAARAVSHALLSAGWSVAVAARRMDQARQLAGKFAGALQPPAPLALEPEAIGGFVASNRVVLIVNATPLGMSPQAEVSPWPTGLSLPSRAFVYDLVYNPPETALLRAARAAGLTGINGLPMLVEQAALAFECWTGLSPSRQAMLDAVRT